MVTILARKSYDQLLHEPCFVCSVQTSNKEYSIKAESKTLALSETEVKGYYSKIYKHYCIYYYYNHKTTVYRHI